ncbi:MAG: hypothetical protein ABR520_04730 [Mycobacteriales bacterium]|nr:hypothetical protein [Frankia sp.]
MATARAVPAYLEVGARRTFAAAVDWPGWCRSGKTEEAALDALADYVARYAVVAKAAKVAFALPADPRFRVVERVPGNATTDFGAPGVVPDLDRRRATRRTAERDVDLVEAAWRVFDGLVAGAPASLRKGPRGGGRDRDKIVEHVLAAETAYARKIGLRLTEPRRGDRPAIRQHRSAIAEALRAAKSPEPATGTRWPPRYAARRIAWHVLDHAWEIEDRSS